DGHWELTLKDGTVYEFPDSSTATRFQRAAVVGIRDRFGHRLALTRGGICQGGTNPGIACTTNAQCSGGGVCGKGYDRCEGGTSPGVPCTTNAQCGSRGACIATDNLVKITSPHGRWIALTYGQSSCPTCVSQITVSQITDNAGRTVSYMYDQYNRLTR